MGISIDRLAYGAYRDAGLVELEQTGLNADQTEEFRQVYNRWIDSQKADGLMIPHIFRKVFDLIPNQGDYTIGEGGDWDTPWPERLERASIILSNEALQPEYKLFPLTIDEWQEWTLKNQITTWSRRYFYEPAFPLGTVHLLYIPSQAVQVALYLEEYLLRIDATGDAEIEYRPGYQEVVETNVARVLAARNPTRSNISNDTISRARESLARVKNVNNRPLIRESDFSSNSRRSNIFNGSRYGNR